MADRPLVMLTNPIHEDGMAILEPVADLVTAKAETADEFRKAAASADGIIVRAKLPDDIADDAPKLKGMVRHGVGLDFIPVEAATAKGIAVANLPGCNTRTVVEYFFSALFHLRRPLYRLDARFRSRGWDMARGTAPSTMEIGGTTLGIVGLGAIGGTIARIGHESFGMQVLAKSRSRDHGVPDVDEVELEELFSRADAIAICCALTEETKGLVNRELIALMKPDAVLVNMSRGAIVETAALRDALEEGRIAGAALDVFDAHPLPSDDPLFKVPNLLLTPHSAAITGTSMRAMSVGAAEEMVRILKGEPPINFVNPDCWKDRK